MPANLDVGVALDKRDGVVGRRLHRSGRRSKAGLRGFVILGIAAGRIVVRRIRKALTEPLHLTPESRPSISALPVPPRPTAVAKPSLAGVRQVIRGTAEKLNPPRILTPYFSRLRSRHDSNTLLTGVYAPEKMPSVRCAVEKYGKLHKNQPFRWVSRDSFSYAVAVHGA